MKKRPSKLNFLYVVFYNYAFALGQENDEAITSAFSYIGSMPNEKSPNQIQENNHLGMVTILSMGVP